jgi:hypothetical protein
VSTVVVATLLSAGTGSVVVDATEADPPATLDDAAADEATFTGIDTDELVPALSVPAMVQVIVVVPEQPAGSEPVTTVTPVGGA